MRFTKEQIRLASNLKKIGLGWKPQVGHYAFDCQQKIKPGSPFQDGVYFFLNFPCFVDYFGGIDNLHDSMVWLPTWEQATTLIHAHGGALGELADGVVGHLEEGVELDFAYGMIERLVKS